VAATAVKKRALLFCIFAAEDGSRAATYLKKSMDFKRIVLDFMANVLGELSKSLGLSDRIPWRVG
jgi:hypothetical protein